MKNLILISTLLFTQLCFGSFVIPDGSITVPKLHTANLQASELRNCSIAASVSSNALTVALKTAAGSDATAKSPCRIAFRNATLTTGTVATVSVTAGLSVVVSSGSTLGHASGATHYIYVYAINSGSGVVLGVSTSIFLDEGALVSTTAEGGAGAADSAQPIYTTSAQTSKPFRLIGRIKISEATAGTWATAPTEIANWPFALKVPYVNAGATGGASTGASSNSDVNYNTEVEDNYNMWSGTSGTFPMDGRWFVSCAVSHSGNTVGTGNSTELALIANGTEQERDWIAGNGNNTAYRNRASAIITATAGQTFKCTFYNNVGASTQLATAASRNKLFVIWLGPN